MQIRLWNTLAAATTTLHRTRTTLLAPKHRHAHESCVTREAEVAIYAFYRLYLGGRREHNTVETRVALSRYVMYNITLESTNTRSYSIV